MKKEYLGFQNRTRQSEPIPQREKDMKQNEAGGYGFKVSDEERLRRFLIIGTDSGTYYTSEKDLTVDNFKSVLDFLQKDASRVLRITADLSEQGRILKNETAIAVLALAWANGYKNEVANVFNQIVRIPTHLFTFMSFLKEAEGGKIKSNAKLRKVIESWYYSNSNLAYHMLKYQQRQGWSHKDLLRIAHVRPRDKYMDDLFGFVAGKEKVPNDPLVQSFIALRKAQSLNEVLSILKKQRVPWEFVPSQWLNNKEVWEVLLPYMPLNALTRVLGRLTYLKVLEPFSENTKYVTERLRDENAIRKARITPVQVGIAMQTYKDGQGRHFEWEPVPIIETALEDAFYMSFKNVEPISQRIVIGIDGSGSMKDRTQYGGMTVIELASLVAYPMLKANPDSVIVAFSSDGEYRRVPKVHSWKELAKKADIGGGTDLSLPVQYAFDKNITADLFVIFTDNETWAGDVHPSQLFSEYRRRVNPNAKLISASMTAIDTSIADTKSGNQFNIIGFDPNYLHIIKEIADIDKEKEVDRESKEDLDLER
jgi:60 kDa SS-A/Ro ribonucleoprotein